MFKLRYIFIVLFLTLAILLWHINSKRSDFFASSFVTYDPKLWPYYEISLLSTEEKEKIKNILAKPFKFLGSGNQTFAFESADGKYVLKFFKFQHLRKTHFSTYLPEFEVFIKLKQALWQSKNRRISQVFYGHYIAYTRDRQNSGLLYAHLNSDEKFNLKAKVVDNLGISHQIPLDDVVFVLQKKGKSFRRVLSHLLDKGRVEEACLLIKNLLSMYLSEYRQGIYDRDHNVMHNVGFIKSEPLRIDLGKLRYDERMKDPLVFKEDLRKVVFQRIDKWVRNYYPFYRKRISEEMIRYLSSMQIEL